MDLPDLVEHASHYSDAQMSSLTACAFPDVASDVMRPPVVDIGDDKPRPGRCCLPRQTRAYPAGAAGAIITLDLDPAIGVLLARCRGYDGADSNFDI